MSGEQRLHRDTSLLLTSADKADGLSLITNNDNNISLLKRGKPIAWFSTAVTEEVIVAFLKLIRDSGQSDNKQVGTK